MTKATLTSARIESIDALRGFAVLGILLINISVFALPSTYLTFPDALPDETGLNFASWTFNEIAVLGGMRTVFSMLFGAGVFLFATRRSDPSEAGEIADAYYRRTILLIGFGLLHSFFLLGSVDILFPYGMAGLFLYSVRRLRSRWLIVLGIAVLSVPLPLVLRNVVRLHTARAASATVEVLERSGQEPDADLRHEANRWAELMEGNRASPEAVQLEIETRRSGYWTNFRHTAWETAERQSVQMYERLFWDVGGMMLIGMALLKLGVLTAARSRRFYLALTIAGFAIGLTVKALDVAVMVKNGFDPWSLEVARLTYDTGRLFLGLGYIGVVMLACRSTLLRGPVRTLSAVGRMALTNYLVQTMVCVLLFQGIGFGLFGRLEPWQLILPVIAIWLMQLLYSPWWLRRHRFGPAEWLWRTLTYGRREPLRREGDRAGTSLAPGRP